MKTIYIVTHCEKNFGKNPNLSKKGIEQTREIKKHLPQDINFVISGCGNRHLETALLLSAWPNIFSSLVGECESLDLIDNKKVIFLANGTDIPFDSFSSLEDMAPAYKPFLLKIEPNTLLIAGRPFMIMIEKFINYQDASSAALYKVNIDEKNEKFTITKIFQA